MTWTQKRESVQELAAGEPEGERGDVWLERVCDSDGSPMSAIAVGGGDNGLWRIRSEQEGTQLVVSHAEALSVADTLVRRSAGRLRPEPHEHAQPVVDKPTTHDRSLRLSHDEARRTQASRGERHSR